MPDALTHHLTAEQITAVLAAIPDDIRAVRPLILARAGKVGHTDKADGSPVTATDLEVEKQLQAAFAARLPEVPVYGEETGYGGDMPEVFWLIDPIDGTKSFIENIPTFTTMAVLIQDKEAVAALIYNHSTDDLYTAQKGQGAYKNGAPLNLRATPLAHKAICKGRFIKTLDDIMAAQDVHCEIGPNGGGFGFTMVAEGTFAARFNMQGGGYTHDYAPGALLVREAGGAIIPIKEDAYTFETRSFVACHPDLEPVLQPHIATLRKLEIELVDAA